MKSLLVILAVVLLALAPAMNAQSTPAPVEGTPAPGSTPAPADPDAGTPEPTPAPAEPSTRSPAAALFRLLKFKINGNFATFFFNANLLAQLKASILKDLAAALLVDEASLEITSLTQGSAIANANAFSNFDPNKFTSMSTNTFTSTKTLYVANGGNVNDFTLDTASLVLASSVLPGGGEDDETNFGPGAIAGTIIGAIAFVALLIVGGFLLKKHLATNAYTKATAGEPAQTA
jgi:hypothetical protein